MKTATGLFARLCDPDHLACALRRMARGKRRRADVAWILFRAEAVLLDLRRDLLRGVWQPEAFSLLFIRDPKPRAIARVSATDRLMHMALVSLLEPVFHPSLMPEDLACRAGGGTHRAVLALQRQMRLHPYAVHLDVKRYFPSIDVGVLRGLLQRRIRDDHFLGVLDQVLDAGAGLLDRPGVRDFLGVSPLWPPPGRGLPVGAFTSQFLATHVYLNGLDHYVKRQLKAPGYVRYVDDLFLFGDSRAELRRWRDEVGRWLAAERGLLLKHPEARILSCAGRLHGLGTQIRRDELRPSARALRRLRGRVAHWLEAPEGTVTQAHMARSMAGTMGLLLG